MVHSVGKGLLDVFKRIQEDRSIVEKDDKGKSPLSIDDENANPEENIARANVKQSVGLVDLDILPPS